MNLFGIEFFSSLSTLFEYESKVTSPRSTKAYFTYTKLSQSSKILVIETNKTIPQRDQPEYTLKNHVSFQVNFFLQMKIPSNGIAKLIVIVCSNWTQESEVTTTT